MDLNTYEGALTALPLLEDEGFESLSAAALRNALIASIERETALREALEYYAKTHSWPNDGPWGVDSRDYGEVARQALNPEPSNG